MSRVEIAGAVNEVSGMSSSRSRRFSVLLNHSIWSTSVAAWISCFISWNQLNLLLVVIIGPKHTGMNLHPAKCVSTITQALLVGTWVHTYQSVWLTWFEQRAGCYWRSWGGGCFLQSTWGEKKFVEPNIPPTSEDLRLDHFVGKSFRTAPQASQIFQVLHWRISVKISSLVSLCPMFIFRLIVPYCISWSGRCWLHGGVVRAAF